MAQSANVLHIDACIYMNVKQYHFLSCLYKIALKMENQAEAFWKLL